MRVKVGQLVNTDAEVNLLDLKPLDRVIAAAINAYRSTNMYRRRYAETEERKQEHLRKVRESLVENMLAVITQEMENNKLLKDKGDTCKGVLIEVPARFKDFFPSIIEVHEFDAYELTVIPPVQVLSKFANPPLLVLVVNKGG